MNNRKIDLIIPQINILINNTRLFKELARNIFNNFIMQSHRNNPYFCPGHCCESAEWQSKRLIIITMEEQEHVLFIKNMVCNRCILVVSEMLKNLNFNPLRIELGKVVIEEPLKPADRFLIRKALEALGFELHQRITHLRRADDRRNSHTAPIFECRSFEFPVPAGNRNVPQ